MASLIVYNKESGTCLVKNRKGVTTHKMPLDEMLTVFAYEAQFLDLFVDGRIYFKMKEEKGV